jgi:hypothetical protein
MHDGRGRRSRDFDFVWKHGALEHRSGENERCRGFANAGKGINAQNPSRIGGWGGHGFFKSLQRERMRLLSYGRGLAWRRLRQKRDIRGKDRRCRLLIIEQKRGRHVGFLGRRKVDCGRSGKINDGLLRLTMDLLFEPLPDFCPRGGFY